RRSRPAAAPPPAETLGSQFAMIRSRNHILLRLAPEAANQLHPPLDRPRHTADQRGDLVTALPNHFQNLNAVQFIVAETIQGTLPLVGHFGDVLWSWLACQHLPQHRLITP